MSAMTYDIQTKSDFLTGSYLVTRIPEGEVDHYALNTIQADCPDFILPFTHKKINGQAEFVYKVGTLSKLHYFAGEFAPREYAELWQSLLKPLLDCSDWFMHPCSFLLYADYLYYDKIKKTVSYIYIPSINGCSGYDAFHEMAAAVSKIMTVSDAALENKVLRSILKDFNPTEFIQMLKDHISESATSQSQKPDCEKQLEPEIKKAPEPEPELEEEIVIDFKPEIKIAQSKKEKDSGGYRIFSSKSKKKVTEKEEPKEEQAKRVVSKKQADSRAEYAKQAEPDTLQQNQMIRSENKQAEIIDITQSIPIMPNGPGLRYVGHAHLPPSIQIAIAEGEIFTIGRFDVSVGKQQSSFEFDKKTKAVSRRHAVIERDIDGYKIVDLASSAGTFVDEKKLPPNTPFGLETGCRVSFGNSGADYVWEVS